MKKKGRKPLPEHLRRSMWSRRFKNETIDKIVKEADKLNKSETAYVEGLIEEAYWAMNEDIKDSGNENNK